MVYVCRMERRIDAMREVARPKGIQSIGSGQICRGCKLNRQGTGFCLVGHLCFEEAQPINQGGQVNPIYGIELPKNVKRALEIDRESGTDFWAKALQLEMSKIFLRKARYIAGGHKTGEPETPTYASVVSRESVRIGFMLAAYNQHKRCWALSSKKYATEAIRNVKIWLEERDMILKTRVAGVLPSGYRPELDTSSYCDQEWQSFFQPQIGVLRWLVELGRIDITTEVSILAAKLAGPREGHVHALLHVFTYINQYDRSRLVLYPSYIVHGEEPVADWSGYIRVKKRRFRQMPQNRMVNLSK